MRDRVGRGVISPSNSLVGSVSSADCVLKRRIAPRFWERRQPVVFPWGIAMSRISRFRLYSQFVLALALAGPLWAQGQGADADQMFRGLDTNRDGKLTTDDAGANNRSMLERIFEMAGKPRSGTVSRAEFQQVFERHRAGNRPSGDSSRPPADERPAAGLPPLLVALDTNQDGRLSKAEFDQLARAFDRLDADRDGQLSSRELEAVETIRGGGNASREPASPSPANRPGRPEPARPANPDRTASRATEPNRPAGRETSLTGVWRGWVVRGRGENPNDGEMEIELTVEGNRMTARELGTRRAPEGMGAGTYTLEGQNGRGNLDAEGTSGPQDGRSYLGIYELDGETLRWCVTGRRRQRPEEMATDRGNYLMILRKQRS